MNPFVILERNKIRLCMYMLLFFSNVSCGQNRSVISDKEQESIVLYDVQGLKYEQLWRFNNTIVRDCYFTRKGEFIDNATWNVEIQTLLKLKDKILRKFRVDDETFTSGTAIVLLLAVPKSNILELRLARGLTSSFDKEMLRVLKDVEQEVLVFSDNPIAVFIPIRITID